MNLAQHILVFTGIIVALAVSDLATSFHRLMINRVRVRWFWLPLGLAVFQLASLIQIFWVDFYIYISVKRLSILAFLPDVILRIIAFLMTAATLPDDVPAEGLDLRDHYWGVARYFWSLSALTLVLIFVFYAPRTTPPGATIWLFAQQWWTNVLSLAISLTLIATRRAWVHHVGVTMMLVLAGYAYLDQTIG